jgi:hypothetical protein
MISRSPGQPGRMTQGFAVRMSLDKTIEGVSLANDAILLERKRKRLPDDARDADFHSGATRLIKISRRWKISREGRCPPSTPTPPNPRAFRRVPVPEKRTPGTRLPHVAGLAAGGRSRARTSESRGRAVFYQSLLRGPWVKAIRTDQRSNGGSRRFNGRRRGRVESRSTGPSVARLQRARSIRRPRSLSRPGVRLAQTPRT